MIDFVHASVCREKLKLTYPFDNRSIIAIFTLSLCCRFGNDTRFSFHGRRIHQLMS